MLLNFDASTVKNIIKRHNVSIMKGFNLNYFDPEFLKKLAIEDLTIYNETNHENDQISTDINYSDLIEYNQVNEHEYSFKINVSTEFKGLGLNPEISLIPIDTENLNSKGLLAPILTDGGYIFEALNDSSVSGMDFDFYAGRIVDGIHEYSESTSIEFGNKKDILIPVGSPIEITSKLHDLGFAVGDYMEECYENQILD